ncbi:hypothetical protein RB195_003025 [Necator americanus]|uniref:Peptidase S1 domain-containing protein n=1 Tax=Necator americanus TaxID=51031 RepID=A0ABR1DLW0_NECAM
MSIKVFHLLGIFLTINCKKITPRENFLLNQCCGGRRPTCPFKVLNGKSVKENEFPFIATLRYSKGEMEEMCGGSLISPLHVLTAAHCILRINDSITESCKKDRNGGIFKFGFNDKPKDWSVYIGSGCSVPEECEKRRQVREILLRGDYNPCGSSNNDIAIIELKSRIPGWRWKSICLPSKDQRLRKVLHSAGTGSDRKSAC